LQLMMQMAEGGSFSTILEWWAGRCINLVVFVWVLLVTLSELGILCELSSNLPWRHMPKDTVVWWLMFLVFFPPPDAILFSQVIKTLEFVWRAWKLPMSDQSMMGCAALVPISEKDCSKHFMVCMRRILTR
jgi:hypothetical protein